MCSVLGLCVMDMWSVCVLCVPDRTVGHVVRWDLI